MKTLAGILDTHKSILFIVDNILIHIETIVTKKRYTFYQLPINEDFNFKEMVNIPIDPNPFKESILDGGWMLDKDPLESISFVLDELKEYNRLFSKIEK